MAHLEEYTKDVVNALSQKKNKDAIPDFEAWVSAENGSSHTAINHWMDSASKRFDDGFHNSKDLESDSEEDSMGRNIARHIATTRRVNPSSKKKE